MWRDGPSQVVRALVRLAVLVILSAVVLAAAMASLASEPLETPSQEVVTADVVRFVPGNPWNAFDNGQAEVAFDHNGRAVTETVEYSGSVRQAGPGGTAEIWFDPQAPELTRPVLTEERRSDFPAFAMLITGLVVAGLVALLDAFRLLGSAGFAGRRRSQWQESAGEVKLASEHLPIGQPLVPEGGRPARCYASAAAALGKYGKRTLAIGAVAGALLLTWAVAHQCIAVSNAEDLARVERTVGQVVGGGSKGLKITTTWVEVRYEVDGHERVENLYGPTLREMPRGTELAVLYDREDPSNLRTPGNANRPTATLLFWPSIFGIFAAAPFLISLNRWMWMRRWMARVPWCTWQATAGSRKPRGWRAAGPVELTTRDAGGREHRALVRLGASTNFGSAESWRPTGQRVLFLAGPGRRGVILPEGSDIPFVVRLPRSLRQSRRWRAAVDQSVGRAATE